MHEAEHRTKQLLKETDHGLNRMRMVGERQVDTVQKSKRTKHILCATLCVVRRNYGVFIWNNISAALNDRLFLKEAEKPKGKSSKRSRT